ncbi:MAG: chloramphenicol acetyltransferase [Roseivivax sp.]|nr:chloramphenicol acetyltransferase [Roseivivax sp.]
MAETILDQATWPRAGHFALFRTYERPHFATTARVDVTGLLALAKPRGVSPYRACLYAIGTGLHQVAELRTRMRGETVVQHDAVAMSMTVPTPDGSFVYGYVPYHADFATFDAEAARVIDTAAQGGLNPHAGSDAVAYLSCLPWLDFTAIDNALPNARDCIPRISWGRFTAQGDGRWDMAMAIQVHHALVDGAHVGAYFAAVQAALDAI